MKVAYGITCMGSEKLSIFYKNIKKLKKYFQYVDIYLNTDKKDVNTNKINAFDLVGNMKFSRENLLEKMSKSNVDAWFVFDSDIEFTEEALIKIKNELLYLKNKYDFISLYYKNDPPIPAFFSLASSLTDFHTQKNQKIGFEKKFFDDSEMNFTTYQTPTNKKINKPLKYILSGKSYARDIEEFTEVIDENDTTTGGAMIYFKKEVMVKNYSWKYHKFNSLTWYDSFRTSNLVKEGYKFAKIPIFVNHNRIMKTISLSWDSVYSYIRGYNYYMSNKDEDWDNSALYLHSLELFFYIKGMIKKILNLKISFEELETINKIKEFLESNNNILNWGEIWKSAL